MKQTENLGMPYIPTAASCYSLNVDTPDSMGQEIHAVMQQLKNEVGNLTDYVRVKLKYKNNDELCDALAAEQIDAVALAIYNIEVKKLGLIIGDQTGIGKGRMAAAMLRYGWAIGKKPIFITEKVGLFSSMFKDMIDINSEFLKPFILNSSVPRQSGNVKIRVGEKIWHESNVAAINRVLNAHGEPFRPLSINSPIEPYDVIFATYTQFDRHAAKPNKKGYFLENAASNNVVILDESHNAGGDGNRAETFLKIVKNTMGVVFLSATYAKKPKNMPIYALKTSMKDASLNDESLGDAIAKGGVALQEVVSSDLVAEGQMVRRERTFENVKVNYLHLGPVPESQKESNDNFTLYDLKKEHFAIVDSITAIIRRIIKFEQEHIQGIIDRLDDDLKEQQGEVEKRKGTKNAGVDNYPVFSRVFNITNQMLFSLKADAVANRAIDRLKSGFKPVIAFSSTMESFYNDIPTDEVIKADFNEVLLRVLTNTLKYTVKEDGESEKKELDITELDEDTQDEYFAIVEQIKNVSSGITISPIDYVKQKIEAAGYKVAEVTGRKRSILLDDKGNGIIKSLAGKKLSTDVAFFKFNNNEYDVLMINQSGSTGESAHAHVPKGGSITEKDVKPRCMLIQQAELNINTEVQKRGRIFRTGQIMNPEYDYIISSIPAEQRLMMMLQKKLKSLDANTTSNQKNSEAILNTDDFLNKYGDEVVLEYLNENRDIYDKLGRPVSFAVDKNGNYKNIENAAHITTGRVAILPSEEQLDFYDEVKNLYKKYVKQLWQLGEYDLEVETLDLDAVTDEKKIAVTGKGNSRFGTHTYLEKCTVNNLRKPYTKAELVAIIKSELNGKTPIEHQQQLIEKLNEFESLKSNEIAVEVDEQFDEKEDRIKLEKGYIEARDPEQYYAERVQKLQSTKAQSLSTKLDKLSTQINYIRKLFKEFYIGQSILLPQTQYGLSDMNVEAVFLGFGINEKKNNPYAPSAIDVRFAVANSIKQIDLVASAKDKPIIDSIIVASRSLKVDSESLNLDGLGYYKRRNNIGHNDGVVNISTDNETFIRIESKYNRSWVNKVKVISSSAIFNRNNLYWTIPYSEENLNNVVESTKSIYSKATIKLTQKDGEEVVLLENGIDTGNSINSKAEPTNFIEKWDELRKNASNDRVTEYIATGNLLQAVGKYKSGRLIQYTLREGGTKKGLMLSKAYVQKNIIDGQNRVTVSLLTALPVIKTLLTGKVIKLEDEKMSFGRDSEDVFIFSVPANKKYQRYYQDEELFTLTVDGEFYLTGSNYVAKYSSKNLDKAVSILNNKHNVNAMLADAQFERVKDTVQDVTIKNLPEVDLPQAQPQDEIDEELLIAEAEAEALLLMLELEDEED